MSGHRDADTLETEPRLCVELTAEILLQKSSAPPDYNLVQSETERLRDMTSQ